ncbi:MAG: PP2C family protein-serine/threonine phosphatase [Nannocystaceae bacterium]
MKLRSAILASSVLLVVGVGVGAALTVSAAIDSSARRDLAEELDRSVEVFRDLQGYRASLYRAQVDSVAQEPRVKAVVNSADIDHATILDAARELQRSSGADLLLLTDGDGILRADTLDPKAEGFDLSGMPVIAGALADGSNAGIWVADDTAYEVQARALTYGDESFGVLVLGFTIDDRIAATLHRQTGAEVLLTLAGEPLAASSLKALPGDAAALLAALPASLGDDAETVDLAGSRHLARAGAFPSARDDQELRFVILRSLDKALADSRAIVRQLLLIAGLAVLVAIALAFLVARRLARPVDDLVDFTRTIAAGELAPKHALTGPDEIRTLGAAMNRMVSELAQSRAELAKKQRLENEMEIAARIQTSIVPAAPRAPGLEIAALMRTATEVGGDYFDVFPDEHGAWIGVGDVAGHGLRAGLVMLMVQSSVASLVRERPDAAPSELVGTLNATIYDNVRERLGQDEHVTFTLFRYRRGGGLRFSGAHEPFLLLRAGADAAEEVMTPGTWLGVLPDIRDALVDSRVELAAGDLVLLYSDGLIEARDADGEQFGIDRVQEIVLARRYAPVATIAAALADACAAWRAEADDDVTLLLFRVQGGAPTA